MKPQSPSLPELGPRLDAILESQAAGRIEDALRAIADAFGAQTVTLHRAETTARRLRLVAALGLPEAVLAVTREIPFGKGMAGLCAERRDVVTVCNLQTDDSGTARPGARETGVAGAIVVPVEDERGALLGTLGIGRGDAHGILTSLLWMGHGVHGPVPGSLWSSC